MARRLSVPSTPDAVYFPVFLPQCPQRELWWGRILCNVPGHRYHNEVVNIHSETPLWALTLLRPLNSRASRLLSTVFSLAKVFKNHSASCFRLYSKRYYPRSQYSLKGFSPTGLAEALGEKYHPLAGTRRTINPPSLFQLKYWAFSEKWPVNIFSTHLILWIGQKTSHGTLAVSQLQFPQTQ